MKKQQPLSANPEERKPMENMFSGRTVVLGIAGGIAAYKAAELVRLLKKTGADVHCIMTDAAREFIGPLTLQTLTKNPVAVSLFDLWDEREIGHISLAERADLFIIAPATANSIGKIAGGIADDMLSTVVMATTAPILIAPAMNVHMWETPAVRENIRTLTARGCHIVEPECGELACGAEGTGRLADVNLIFERAAALLSPQDYRGVNVLITAGPTREYLDPARFLSNPSSGKMGYALARALQWRGAHVTLISGPVELQKPAGVTCVAVENAREMAAAVEKHYKDAHLVIKAAAVADYRPDKQLHQKTKKQNGPLSLALERNPDILAGLGANKSGRILVGFAAETHDLLAHAQSKRTEKNLDMIIANDISRPDTGFESDTNQVCIITAGADPEHLPLMPKTLLAHAILDRIKKLLPASLNT
jgi:phosphopantothenoylcysteine decarboxylase/phosphopantothenate--cysteine ligase